MAKSDWRAEPYGYEYRDGEILGGSVGASFWANSALRRDPLSLHDTGSTPSESLPFLKIDGFYDEMDERFEVLL
jgi:hypothetical protein